MRDFIFRLNLHVQIRAFFARDIKNLRHVSFTSKFHKSGSSAKQDYDTYFSTERGIFTASAQTVLHYRMENVKKESFELHGRTPCPVTHLPDQCSGYLYLST